MGACSNSTNKFHPQTKQPQQINTSVNRQKRSHSLEETQETISEVSTLKEYLKKGRSTLLYKPQTPLPIISELSVEQFESKIDQSINSKCMSSDLIEKEERQKVDECLGGAFQKFGTSGYKSKNSYI